jgi:hypothetical protein
MAKDTWVDLRPLTFGNRGGPWTQIDGSVVISVSRNVRFNSKSGTLKKFALFRSSLGEPLSFIIVNPETPGFRNSRLRKRPHQGRLVLPENQIATPDKTH